MAGKGDSYEWSCATASWAAGGAEAEDTVWELSESERRALGYKALPSSLDRALGLMEESELVAETLGEQVFNYVLLNKRREWREYRLQVTPYELESNLPIL